MKFDVERGSYRTSEMEPLSPLPEAGEAFFFRKHRAAAVSVCLIGVVYVLLGRLTGFTHKHAVTGLPSGIQWLIQHFYPSSDSIKALPIIVRTLGNAAVLAVSATVAAAFFALGAALAGSYTTGTAPVFRVAVRMAAAFFRNIPAPAWSLLLLLSFKQNMVTGFAALFLLTFGHLTRAFIEIIDNHAEESYRALDAAGVPYLSVIVHGVLPNTVPLFISWLLYAIETNIRDSALIGILTGTGIGFLFNLYFKSFRYHEAGLIICILMLTVIAVDCFANIIRRILL